MLKLDPAPTYEAFLSNLVKLRREGWSLREAVDVALSEAKIDRMPPRPPDLDVSLIRERLSRVTPDE